MELKELMSKVKEKYGSLVLDIEGKPVEIKPTIEFYEEFMIYSALEDRERLVKFLLEKLPKIVMKSAGLNEEEARFFVIEYIEEFLSELMSKFEKKKKK